MGWRVVSVSSVSKLDYKMDYLVVRNRESTTRIHLSEISVLIIESTAVSMTAYLLCELAKRNVDVIFCDEKRLPMMQLHRFYGSHDTSLKYRDQIKWNDGLKQVVWAEIIHAKIQGEISVLRSLYRQEAELLNSYLGEIQPGDITNREGHAAKVYFNALFGKDFSRSSDDVINSALNYGYSIILSVVAREVTANGYATQFGLFHDNMFNPFNLASDLMEPFRVFVDAKVFGMNMESFAHDEKMKIIDTLNDTITIAGQKQTLLNGIKIYVRSVFNALNENEILQMKFPVYELSVYESDSVL